MKKAEVIHPTDENVLEAILEMPSHKEYEKVDLDTGELSNKYLYLEGRPKQYRYDAKEGVFNLNGVDKLGASFTFQPIAWRFFKDDILQLGPKNWVELFFVDEKNCLSVIMFHGYSVENLIKMSEPLFYDKLTLKDVVITAKAERKENTKTTPKSVYYLAEFSYQLADAAIVKELSLFATDNKIYRIDTLTPEVAMGAHHQYFVPASEVLEKNAETVG